MSKSSGLPTAPQLWTVLAKCYRAVSGFAARSIEENGLCFSDFAVLEALLHKGPLSISEIGKRVLLTSGSMTAAVDRLEEKGLVQRATTAKDRRARVIHLTETGQAFIHPIFLKHKEDLESLMAFLDDQEKQLLYEPLKKLGRLAEEALEARKQADQNLTTKEKGSTKQ